MEELVGPGGVVIVTGHIGDPPDGWGVEYDGAGVQMTGAHLTGSPDEVAASRPDLEVVPLGGPDAADMVGPRRAGPARPVLPRTWELGGYVGVAPRRAAWWPWPGSGSIRRGGARSSAVATHPDHRRRGLGEHLVRVVAAGIAARGETPFLHAAATTPTPSGSTRRWASPTGGRSASWPPVLRGTARASPCARPCRRSPADGDGLRSGAGPVTATAAGMPSRVTVRTTRPVVRSTSTRAPSPLHTQARPGRTGGDALGRRVDGNGRAHQAAGHRHRA